MAQSSELGMSSEQLIESGVEQCGVDGMGVIEQEQMLAVLLEREIEVRIDDELIALLGIEIGDGVVAG